MFCETDCANRRTTWPRCELWASANSIKARVESGRLLDIRAAFLFLETKWDNVSKRGLCQQQSIVHTESSKEKLRHYCSFWKVLLSLSSLPGNYIGWENPLPLLPPKQGPSWTAPGELRLCAHLSRFIVSFSRSDSSPAPSLWFSDWLFWQWVFLCPPRSKLLVKPISWWSTHMLSSLMEPLTCASWREPCSSASGARPWQGACWCQCLRKATPKKKNSCSRSLKSESQTSRPTPNPSQKRPALGKQRYQSLCPGFKMSSLSWQPEPFPPSSPLWFTHMATMEQASVWEDKDLALICPVAVLGCGQQRAWVHTHPLSGPGGGECHVPTWAQAPAA